MPDQKLADIDFTLEWKSTSATHTDTYYVANVNPYVDKFPRDLAEKIIALKVGESCSGTYPAMDVLDEGYSNKKVIPFKPDLFDQNFKGQYSPPTLNRFYPSAIASQGLETDATDYTPFRIISMSEDNIVADKNHPLAKYYLTLTATKLEERYVPNDGETRKKNIGKLISSRGPGMQAPFEYGDSVFFKQYPFERINDQKFSILQIDSLTSEQIAKLYSQQLPNYSKILDLMSDDSSYLEKDYKTGLLVGIGADEASLIANERLDTYEVQDLYKDSTLPFEANSFDDAICTLAIETLTDPLLIFNEVARVVNSGGKFIITFSDSGSSPDAISLWGQLHPFERIQLVLEYFRQSGGFKELNTLSRRGVLRPTDDNPLNRKKLVDPLYAVWGIVK